MMITDPVHAMSEKWLMMSGGCTYPLSAMNA